ncbi:hypothetical protein Droror1_Dr00012175, partial [Drosera rotundifolia]
MKAGIVANTFNSESSDSEFPLLPVSLYGEQKPSYLPCLSSGDFGSGVGYEEIGHVETQTS